MTNKECRNTRREIDEVELGHRPSARAMAHLTGCVGCQEFQAERTSLRELVGSLEPVVAPPDFDMRLRARIAAEKYDRRRQPFSARLISTPALAAAALFVIVAGSVYWIARRPSNPAVTPNNPEVAKNKIETNAPATVNPPASDNATAPLDEGHDVAVNNPNRGVHRNRGSRTVSSEDLSLRGAEVISQSDSNQAYVPSRPVEFALQNERGQTRKISLPAVSFGAQNLVSDTRREIAYSPSSRVW
jgi:hypothetical protein